MNPFDLPGPAFLAFYLVACGAAGLVFRGVLRLLERGDVPKIPEVDPYLMASLREGEPETIKLAAMGLVERKLLVAGGKTLTSVPDAAARVRRPIERAILKACDGGLDGHLLLKDDETKRAAAGFSQTLKSLGLRASPNQTVIRFLNAGVMVGGLWILAAVKVSIAMARGRTNVQFLVMEALFLPALAAFLLLFPHRTTVGERVLADMKVLFRRLCDRAHTLASDSYEASLLAGVYGFATVAVLIHQPGAVFAAPPASGGGGDGGSSCGSSCGGGCGGGCGGCGG